LSDAKIIPTIEMISKCTSHNTLDSFMTEPMFIDDDILEYIEKLTNKYSIVNTTNKTVIRVYNSLSDGDKQVFIRLRSLVHLPDLIRYNIHLTREYTEMLMQHGYWTDIVFLLHLSSMFNYILDYIDEEMILRCSSELGRLWFHNNILVGEIQLVTPIKTLNKRYVRVDIDNLIKNEPIRYNIVQLELQYKESLETIRRNALGLIGLRDKYSTMTPQ
jgi:hypothetical protein